MSLLTIGVGRIDPDGSAVLRSLKKLCARNDGDLTSAHISAAHYAKKRNKTMYLYKGDCYGNSVWRVSDKKSDYLCPINNSQRRLASVGPDLTVTWYELTG